VNDSMGGAVVLILCCDVSESCQIAVGRLTGKRA
jgi:hypothetical protein